MSTGTAEFVILRVSATSGAKRLCTGSAGLAI